MRQPAKYFDRDGEDTGALLVLDPAGIDHLPWRSVPGCPGVEEKELWRSGDLVHALIRYEPGASTAGTPHQVADHHIWVISGAATIAGRPVVAGSYVHVPPTAEHPIRDVAGTGCVLLQLHHRYHPGERRA